MYSLQTEGFLGYAVQDLMIPADKVAHVQLGNNLEHALLVLTKTGYAAIPVLNPDFQLQGLISTNKIMDSILGLERIEFERLEKMKVEEVMNNQIPVLKLEDTLKKAINLVIDHPFLCVVNENDVLEGIFTRRVILKQMKKNC
ncbi:cyclic-di-AMP-binding protein CbpB [Bacillus carboniphilus]|uniref:Cyclic-di-AMP-binding protein CbpB n=1 Tax=Bacillus carboniphilus TaxID=86663 RepID=A0ABY9JXF8_9BACI|nr:cyclic-di-AMP-binding protein CbpB [Bacillus carboniphilus]WLR43198.1 cyclic-di-AMP-binding protein CbpB [Bacillus carboniphilus]